MSTQSNETTEKFFELKFRGFRKTFILTFRINVKVALAIAIPLVVKLASIAISYYGRSCP